MQSKRDFGSSELNKYLQQFDVDPEEVKRLTFVVNNDKPTSMLPPDEIMEHFRPEIEEITGTAVTRVTEKSSPVDMLEEKIVFKPVRKIIERPVEVIRKVEKVIRKEVIKTVNIETNEIVEIPVPYEVKKQIYVPDYRDEKKDYCVSETFIPKVNLTQCKTAECAIYSPKVKIVDVYVPKIVQNAIEISGTTPQYKPVSTLSKAQWNSIVMRLNPELCEYGNIDHLPVHRNEDNTVIAYKATEPVGAPIP